MSDTIKCLCSHCGAKYRLPIEAQGRTARCKRCGEKFQVPAQDNLEDTILTWLNGAEDEEEETVSQPRVINMPKDPDTEDSTKKRVRGPIRMKAGKPKRMKPKPRSPNPSSIIRGLRI